MIGILTSSAFALASLAAPGQAAAPPAPTAAAERSAQRKVTLSVAAILNGSPLGDVVVETEPSGLASIDAVQLARLLEPVVSRTTLAALLGRATGRTVVPIAELSSEDLRIRFDLQSLTVLIELPVNARAARSLAIVDQRQIERTAEAPEEVSAGVTVNLGGRVRGQRTFGALQREPLTALVDGFANLGGKDGVYLIFQGGYSEGGDPVRQRTTLFHDDVASAVRYSLGDLDTQSFGSYYAPASLLGIGIERLYQEIQPYRNLRAAGRGAVSIERQSRVDVMVNGTLYRSLSLTPGQYNLRDFPFLDGLNDVELIVRDDSGRQERISLSYFSDIDLLDPSVSIFSLAAGLRRERFGGFVTPTYRETPTVTGFYQRGINTWLTVGGGVQADKRNALVTGQLVVGTPIGLIGTEAALDVGRSGDPEAAFLVNYRVRGRGRGGRSDTLDVDLQYRTVNFSPLQESLALRNPFSFDLNARYQRSLDSRTFVTLGAGHSVGRQAQEDVQRASAGLFRTFRRFNVNFDYSYRNGAVGADHRATISFSLRLSPDDSVQARYDTLRNRVTAEYSHQGIEALGQTNAQLLLGRDDFGHSASAQVEHISNRFRAFVRHDHEKVEGRVAQTTDLNVNFGIGYAGGKIALGRDAARGFSIVAAHSSLKESRISVFDRYSEKPIAATGALGPALVPTRRPYALNSVEVKVDDLPIGYDIGPGRFDILPGAASGYRFIIGSAASHIVIGTIVDSAGQPVAFLSGSLQPLSGGDAQAVPFFTNRTGRMVAQKVAPGRYAVIPTGSVNPIAEIDVPEDPAGPVQIGTLTTREAE